jgi:hypothetical protein
MCAKGHVTMLQCFKTNLKDMEGNYIVKKRFNEKKITRKIWKGVIPLKKV